MGILDLVKSIFEYIFFNDTISNTRFRNQDIAIPTRRTGENHNSYYKYTGTNTYHANSSKTASERYKIPEYTIHSPAATYPTRATAINPLIQDYRYFTSTTPYAPLRPKDVAKPTSLESTIATHSKGRKDYTPVLPASNIPPYQSTRGQEPPRKELPGTYATFHQESSTYKPQSTFDTSFAFGKIGEDIVTSTLSQYHPVQRSGIEHLVESPWQHRHDESLRSNPDLTIHAYAPLKLEVKTTRSKASIEERCKRHPNLREKLDRQARYHPGTFLVDLHVGDNPQIDLYRMHSTSTGCELESVPLERIFTTPQIAEMTTKLAAVPYSRRDANKEYTVN